jgi:hypothetical protein
MKNIFILFILCLNSIFVKAQSIDVSNLATFVTKNADSVYIAKDSVVYKLWYPEQGILVSFIHSNTVKSSVKISNHNLFTVDFSEVYLALSQVDSVKLVEDKELQFLLEVRFYVWCNKKRTLKECENIASSDIWKKFKIKIILDYKKDGTGYIFYKKNQMILPNDIMRKILIFFEDD